MIIHAVCQLFVQKKSTPYLCRFSEKWLGILTRNFTDLFAIHIYI